MIGCTPLDSPLSTSKDTCLGSHGCGGLREAVSMRGGPAPHACWTFLTSGSHSSCLGRGFAPSGGGYAEGVDILVLLFLGGSWGTFSHFFRIFFAFWAHLKSSWHVFAFLFRFFSIFYRFWMDLGRILGGFWKDFSKVFRFFLKTANFVKYSVLPRKNHYICYVALLKNNKKSTQNHRKSDANLG